jgi:hypothetical protein
MKKWNGTKLTVLSQADAGHISQQLRCIAAACTIVFVHQMQGCRARSDLRLIYLDEDSGRGNFENDIDRCLAACGNENIMHDDDLKTGGDGGDLVAPHGETIECNAALIIGDE